jgi:putative colanic acid biosynthesis acetyltransferase WcaF
VNHLDISGNRTARKYRRRENIERVLWALATPLFRYSPRSLYGWRSSLLRLFGAQIGHGVRIYPSVRIFLPRQLSIGDETTIGDDVRLYNLGQLDIASQVTISQCAHLCGGSHDHRDPTFPLIRAAIAIGNASWICADSFIGPGVHVGEGAVVAARAVAMRDVPAWQIVAGNPAVPIGVRILRTAVAA